MTAIFDRFTIKALAGAGLCATALTLSPHAVAAPLKTGGYNCLQTQAADGALAAAPCSAAAVEASGIVAPAAAPVPVGPVAAPVPVAPVVPPVPAIAAPLLAGAPIPAAAPAPIAAPITEMVGTATGKGVPIVVPPGEEPASGVAVPPGPTE